MIGQKVEVPRMLEHPKAQTQTEQNTQCSFLFYHTNSPLEIVEIERFKRSFNAMLAAMSSTQRRRMTPILWEASEHATPSVEQFIKGRLSSENGL